LLTRSSTKRSFLPYVRSQESFASSLYVASANIAAAARSLGPLYASIMENSPIVYRTPFDRPLRCVESRQRTDDANGEWSFRVPRQDRQTVPIIEVRVHDYAYGTKHKQTQNTKHPKDQRQKTRTIEKATREKTAALSPALTTLRR